jgi:hypothetical protein
MTRRHNGEGSIYPVKDSHGRVTGYRRYVWCTKPDGERYRKYVKGQTYEATQRAWLKLRDEASRRPVSSDVPKLGDFLSYWLKEIVQPNLAPKTYQTYELFARLHIDPYLGHKRLDKLQVKDVRQWLNKLASVCQCCTQGKTSAGQNPSGDAAQSASAAGKSWLRGAVRMPATRFALLLPAPSRMRSSLVIPWP